MTRLNIALLLLVLTVTALAVAAFSFDSAVAASVNDAPAQALRWCKTCING